MDLANILAIPLLCLTLPATASAQYVSEECTAIPFPRTHEVEDYMVYVTFRINPYRYRGPLNMTVSFSYSVKVRLAGGERAVETDRYMAFIEDGVNQSEDGAVMFDDDVDSVIGISVDQDSIKCYVD